MKKLAVVILISGRGSNMQAIVEAHDPLVEIRFRATTGYCHRSA